MSKIQLTDAQFEAMGSAVADISEMIEEAVRAFVERITPYCEQSPVMTPEIALAMLAGATDGIYDFTVKVLPDDDAQGALSGAHKHARIQMLASFADVLDAAAAAEGEPKA